MKEEKKPAEEEKQSLDGLLSLLKWVISTDITEFSLERDGEKVHLKRSSQEQRLQKTLNTIKEPVVIASPLEPREALIKNRPISKSMLTIDAPMVGTFYRASAPEVDQYVNVGDILKKGQIVCIIEAMKIMNEIESEIAGRIVSILQENGKPVGFGTPLFEIEPVTS